MSSMAQDAIDMGLDPVIAPDGREWCESSHRQSDISREIWGDLQDGCHNNYISDYENKHIEEEPTWFASAKEAQDYAKANPGIVITRSPDGNGYIVKNDMR